MSASVAYCFDTFQTYAQALSKEDLHTFLLDTLAYKRFEPRTLYQEYKWLLDEGAYAEWLTEYLTDRGADGSMTEAVVESAFAYNPHMTDKDYGNSLMKETYKWLESWEPAKTYRSVNLVEPILNASAIKTVVLTNTTADSSTLLSLKTELADTKRQLDARTYELGQVYAELKRLKQTIGNLVNGQDLHDLQQAIQ